MHLHHHSNSKRLVVNFGNSLTKYRILSLRSVTLERMVIINAIRANWGTPTPAYSQQQLGTLTNEKMEVSIPIEEKKDNKHN